MSSRAPGFQYYKMLLTIRLFLLLAACIALLATGLIQLSFFLEYQGFCNTSNDTLDNAPVCQLAYIMSINRFMKSKLDMVLQQPFFRYFKIDLDRKCPFWDEPLRCFHEYCAVDVLSKDQVPDSLFKRHSLSEVEFPNYIQDLKIFGHWNSMQGADFCVMDNEKSSGVYVDLLANPERFTGYSGPSATKIWSFIYNNTCDSQEPSRIGEKMESSSEWSACSERKLFYRLVSGMHASISTHIADQFYNKNTGYWENNLELFNERVGNSPERVQNMFLVYAILLRAVQRAGPYLGSLDYNCVSSSDDSGIREFFTDIAPSVIYPPEFDSILLNENISSPSIIAEFKRRFNNAVLVMDCVSCEKCRLWGKIQFSGLGTALKILFGNEEERTSLRRCEIVALINVLGRISESIDAANKFLSYTYSPVKLDALFDPISLLRKYRAAILASFIGFISAFVLKRKFRK